MEGGAERRIRKGRGVGGGGMERGGGWSGGK